MAKLKVDARNVVGIIGGDEAKTDQIVAGQQKDYEKVEELADKLTEQSKNLGSEYLVLMESLGNVILSSKDAQEIESLFDKLGESCPD